jgi:hypothetical protein
MILARFNQGEGQEENAIVTATGKYVIAWDFKKVKKGPLRSMRRVDSWLMLSIPTGQPYSLKFRFGIDSYMITCQRKKKHIMDRAYLAGLRAPVQDRRKGTCCLLLNVTSLCQLFCERALTCTQVVTHCRRLAGYPG